MTRASRHAAFVLLLAAPAAPSFAAPAITMYWGNQSQANWNGAVQEHSTVDFVGFAPNTYITDQYAGLGVTFVPDVNPYIVQPVDFGIFPLDGYGVDGNGDVEVVFSTPMHAIAGSGPGAWTFYLYMGDTFLGSSGWWPGTPGDFMGVTTSFAFDRAILHIGFDGEVYLDDVYFSTIPAPGAAVVLVIGLFNSRRRR